MATDDEYGPLQTIGPFVRRRILGRQLRELRGDHPIKKAAEYTGLTEASISRIERGKQAILPRTVRSLCQLYGVGAPDVDMLIRQAEQSNDRSLLPLDSENTPDWSAPFLQMEAEASEVWTFEAQSVPGLLQLPAYTHELVRAAEAPDVDPDGATQQRESRQRRLVNEHPPRLHAIIDEAAVRRLVGGAEAMADQIEHLVEMGRLEHVTIQVLPFTAGAHIAMTGAFTMLRFPDEYEMNAVFLEHDHAGLMAERPTDLARYAKMFASLREVSLTHEETSNLLVSLVAQYRANERGTG